MIETCVLAIDPGTQKCGVALVKRVEQDKLELLFRMIAPTEHISAVIHRALAVQQFSLVILGNGTGSKQVVHILRENFTSLGLLLVDEKNTTMQARERYWEHHPRRGWRRLLPATLQVPQDPVDDFVAYILAERVLLEN